MLTILRVFLIRKTATPARRLLSLNLILAIHSQMQNKGKGVLS